jgi:sugar/nucleoside kinase (ribokinase family)
LQARQSAIATSRDLRHALRLRQVPDSLDPAHERGLGFRDDGETYAGTDLGEQRMQDHDVVGIGNAIVDILGRCDDAFLAKFGCTKGSMQLVDAARVLELYDAMGPAIEISGGSVANTMAGIASFGGKAGFIGKTADDQFGQVFRHDIRAAGVTFNTPPASGESEPTGRSLILVTPDGQRTMNTSLGVSPRLGGGEVDADLIASARILYLEGYLFDRAEAKAAFRQAAAIAAKAGRQVALTLSDPFCVDRHRPEFLALIKESVDILFANEAEITSLYETAHFDAAARQAQSDTKLAALTRSEKGSVILSEGRSVAVPAAPVDRVIDTTGAGDLYAAGFLFGVARGKPVEIAGRLGSLAAAEIISHMGARPEVKLSDLARQQGLLD